MTSDAQGSTEKYAGWQKLVAQYQRSDVRRSVWQLVNSFGGYFLFLVLMYLSLQVGYWLTLLLAIPTAGFLVRIFIIQHDCGHGSFFASRRANDRVGAVCGAFTFTAYKYWRKSHAIHHAHHAELEERGTGDVWTLTVDEYLAAPWWKRAVYRGFRHPLFLLGVAPGAQFLITNRIPLGAQNWRSGEKASVWWTNIAILSWMLAAGLLIGFGTLLMIQLPVILLAATAGTWLFYVQHQFERTYWEHTPEWSYTLAALDGSSYYKLPRLLQWFTGNIGFHHIHHLSPRIPNYKLQECHDQNPIFQRVTVLTIRSSLKTLSLSLWDEERRQLVSFRTALQAKRAAASVSA
jgi:acyl-lipid omega-6 desaturase (Delta-12 desaturase)